MFNEDPKWYALKLRKKLEIIAVDSKMYPLQQRVTDTGRALKDLFFVPFDIFNKEEMAVLKQYLGELLVTGMDVFHFLIFAPSAKNPIVQAIPVFVNLLEDLGEFSYNNKAIQDHFLEHATLRSSAPDPLMLMTITRKKN